MAHHRFLAKEAHESYRSDRMGEAALLFRRAASAALEVGDRRAWFEHTVWAAQANSQLGDRPASLALVMAARLDEPEDAPEHEAWMTRKLVFSNVRETCPEIARLQGYLEDLHDFAATHNVAKGDLPEIEGHLMVSCGDWSKAVSANERSWSEHDGRGYLKIDKARVAALCALRIGETTVCKDWLKAMADCDREWEVNAIYRAEVEVRLALYEGKPACELIGLLRSLEDRSIAAQDAEVKDNLRELAVRVHCLDSGSGDPATRRHPARQELRHRVADWHSVSAKYDARLLFLDYRLACLRDAAGIPPVEDFYYTHPQFVPAHLTPSRVSVLSERLRRARVAAQRALRFGAGLDAMLGCDWRQREVRSRIERIEQIGDAIRSIAY